MSERLLTEKQGAVGWIVFNNPQRRNAVSVDMWEAMPAALERFEADAQVRLIALRGAGDQAFVSGADISQFEQQRSGREAVQRYEEIAEGAQMRLVQSDKPTLAVIRGYCLGAGVNIALACDLRLAAELCAEIAANAPLSMRTGKRIIRELLRTPREFDAALATGWVKECFESADYQEGRRAFMEKRKPVFKGG